MAGEIYPTLTFRGAGGYAYGHGGPACYILGYACLVYIISYGCCRRSGATHASTG